MPLGLGAAHPLQEVEFALGFDAFSGRFHPEAACKLYNSPDDRPGVFLGRKIVDEHAIDLDLVKWEVSQIAQGRMAGAELGRNSPNSAKPLTMKAFKTDLPNTWSWG
jgi:hypothetical protein